MGLEASPRLGKIRKHLRGVKRRLLYVFLAFGIGASLTWYFRTVVMLWLLAPAREQLSPTGQPIFTSPTEMFSLTIGLAIKGGLVVGFPVLTYHVARFLSPLLSKRQRHFLVLFLPASLLCYLAGIAFAYFVLLPTGLQFLLHFGTEVAVPMIRISEYMTLVFAMLFWLGVVFELPLIMMMLVKLRIVSYQQLKRLRRYVPAMAFILSAIITPTFDIINQTLVAVPIILLYEVGLVLSWLATGGLGRLTLWLRTRERKQRHRVAEFWWRIESFWQ